MCRIISQWHTNERFVLPFEYYKGHCGIFMWVVLSTRLVSLEHCEDEGILGTSPGFATVHSGTLFLVVRILVLQNIRLDIIEHLCVCCSPTQSRPFSSVIRPVLWLPELPQQDKPTNIRTPSFWSKSGRSSTRGRRVATSPREMKQAPVECSKVG